ncbi:MAG: DUF859 domain-containing protein [Oscillospiraceae bacterium]|jgi:hypothetical protein|nr:DUF859 domain-containing protein [Oscillospiraceae bacterium]
MATYKSNTYQGRYLQLVVTEKVNSASNTSALSWTLTSTGGSSNFYSIAPTKVTINGTTVYNKGATSWDTEVFPAKKGSISGTINVTHNTDGKKTVSIGFSTAVYYGTASEYGGSMALTNIDRTAPTVSMTYSSVTVSSIVVSASSSTTCDRWYYSTDNGSTWTLFDSTEGTAKSYTITGLSSNTQYTVKVKARKKSNQVEGQSAAFLVKTLGGTVINSADTITADNSTVTITLNTTVMNASYTHNLSVMNGNSVIFTISGISWSAGTATRTITLTAAQRTALLAAMSSVKSFTATLSLQTLNGSSSMGGPFTFPCTVQTTAANSAPLFSGFSFSDTNATTLGITGDSSKLVQNYSSLTIVCDEATAQNGASIVSYSSVCADVSKSGSGTTIDMGSISKSGTQVITVTVTDSRGYSAVLTQNVEVSAYVDIWIDSYAIRRANGVDALTQAEISANISEILIADVNKNGLVSLQYRCKKNNEENYSDYTSIPAEDITVTDTKITFNSDGFASFDADFTYNIQFTISDKLSSNTVTATLPRGIPTLRYLRKYVDGERQEFWGVFNPAPTRAWDVTGDVGMNGYNVMGYVRTVDGEDFDNINDTGIHLYTAQTASDNAPAGAGAGLLEVLAAAGGNLIQRFTAFGDGNAIYTRVYINTAWTAWSVFQSQQDTGWIEVTEFQNNFEAYSDTTAPRYRKIGNTVYVTGACTATNTIAASTTDYPMFILPEGFRPTIEVDINGHSSSYSGYLGRVRTDGAVTFGRLESGGVGIATSSNVWIPLDYSFPVD